VNGFTEDPVLPGSCGAYVAPGVWKEFDCYNLAAIGKTTGDDPFTPSWRLIGGYWQWGRKGPDPSQWYDTNTEHFAHGPVGPGLNEANYSYISGWDTTYAHDGSWADGYKTANDPCPPGFRVPTQSQWEGVLKNNTQSIEGTWSTISFSAHTSYSAARFFGDDLMLPATGFRASGRAGSLYARGYNCGYWSSTEHFSSSDDAWCMDFDNRRVLMYSIERSFGFSVRCVAE
jgi:uncharacterized protein (TIGR02145 family)